MKKSLLWLLAAAPLSVWAQSKPYTISGQLKNVPATQTWVYIGLYKGGQPALDSAKVTEGKYTFTGTTEDEPTFGSLFFGKPIQGLPTPPANVTNIFVEPGNIQVTHVDSFSNVTITGSAANAELAKLNKIQDPIAEKMQPLMTAYRAAYAQGDKETMKQLEKQGNALEEESNAAYETYLKQNPTSPIALYVIQRWMPYAIDAEKLAPIFAKLPAAMVSSKTGQALKTKMEVAEKTSIGKIAPDFAQNDTLGNPVKLSSLRGKYVLVDFWASWCRPCRAENPNVVKAFNQYKDKGFTVLGVSLDQPDGKAKWLKAIHDDGLTWTHVSDLQFWNNAAAKEYGVQSIPQNFLIDPQGNIAGKNLRGEDLEKKLAELIKG